MLVHAVRIKEGLCNYSEKYPTPAMRDYKGQNSLKHIKEKPRHNSQLPNALRKKGIIGQLNPDWVEWLMGWPIGWSSLEPIKDLLWIDWSEDPAESKENNFPTPTARDYKSGKGKKPRKFSELTPLIERAKNKEDVLIPRVATGIKDRINRLKAIGNGQVPQCAAIAWRFLTDEI